MGRLSPQPINRLVPYLVFDIHLHAAAEFADDCSISEQCRSESEDKSKESFIYMAVLRPGYLQGHDQTEERI